MRRATGPMMAAWLLATLGAVGVAWVGVHPVADLGFGERPPVPRPEIVKSPTYDGGNDSSDASGPGGPHSEDTPGDGPGGETSGSPGPSLPTRTPDKPKPPTVSPGSPTPPATPSAGPTQSPPDTVYREASTDGGTATFEYVEGSDVYVVDAEPKPGWEVGSYRYYRDWVVVEFVSYDHRSTAHAYIDEGKAVVEVVEEDTP